MFQLNKDVLVNSATDYPVSFTLAGASSTAALGDTMHIKGFGNFKLSEIQLGVKGHRGVAASNGTITVDVASAVTAVGTAVATDTIVNFVLKINTSKFSAEYARDAMTFGYKKVYQVIAKPSDGTGDTLAGVLLRRLHNKIVEENSRYGNVPFTSALDLNDDNTHEVTATTTDFTTNITATSIQLTATDPTLSATFTVEDDDQTSSSVITAFTPVYVVGNEGRNTADYINQNVRVYTDANTNAFALRKEQAPAGSLYSDVSFATSVARTDITGLSAAGQSVTSKAEYVVYVQENAANFGAGNYMSLVLDFLARADGDITLYSSAGAIIQDTSGDDPGDATYAPAEAVDTFQTL